MTAPSKAYQRLQRFILSQMKMSHVYQPVMLMELLKAKGFASVADIAKTLLS